MLARLRPLGLDVGLLLLRVSVASLMVVQHGWPKFASWSAKSATFADPLGVGPATSLALAIFAELFCAAAVGLGLATRLAAVPVVITMLVAAFVVHADDPFQKKEFALLYALPALTLVLTGPGRFSLDALLRWPRAKPAPLEAAGLATGK